MTSVAMSTPPRSRMNLRLLSAAAAAACLLAAAPAAHAGTASISGKHVLYTAAPGEVNVLTVSGGGNSLTFSDSRSPVTAGAGCVQGGPQQATCSAPALTLLVVDAGDLNDDITNGTALASRLSGGGGDD